MAEDALAKAQELASEGWELVSVVPRLLGVFYYLGGWGDRSAGASIERGYDMFFKRPVPSAMIGPAQTEHVAT